MTTCRPLAAMSGFFLRHLRYSFVMRNGFLKSAWMLQTVLLAIALGSTLASAQRLVDPSQVAPEFREAAEKRRAEQLKQLACNKAANDAKVAPRDRGQFIIDCFDRPDGNATDLSAATRNATPDIKPAAAPK